MESWGEDRLREDSDPEDEPTPSVAINIASRTTGSRGAGSSSSSFPAQPEQLPQDPLPGGRIPTPTSLPSGTASGGGGGMRFGRRRVSGIPLHRRYERKGVMKRAVFHSACSIILEYCCTPMHNGTAQRISSRVLLWSIRCTSTHVWGSLFEM